MTDATAAVPALTFRVKETTAPIGQKLALGAMVVAVGAMPVIKPGGPGNAAPVDALMGLAITAVFVRVTSPGTSVHVPYLVSTGILLIAGSIAAFAGPVPTEGALALIQDVVLLLWCAAIANLCRSSAALGVILRAWAISSAVWASLLVIGVVSGNDTLSGMTAENGARATLTFGDANVAANYFFVSLMIVWASGYPGHRLLRFSTYVMLISALLLTGSNGGIAQLGFGASVAWGIEVARRWGTLPALACAAAMLLAAGAMITFVSPADIQSRAAASSFAIIRDGIGRSGESADDRGTLLSETMGLYRDGGVLGRGPRSTKHVLATEQAHRVKEAHNDYIAALIERGILGGIGLAVLIAALLMRSTAVVLRPLAAGFGRSVPRPGPLVGAVLGVLLAGLFYEVLHFRHVWALFGIVAGVHLWGRE